MIKVLHDEKSLANRVIQAALDKYQKREWSIDDYTQFIDFMLSKKVLHQESFLHVSDGAEQQEMNDVNLVKLAYKKHDQLAEKFDDTKF